MESLDDLTKKKNGGNHFAAFSAVLYFTLKGPIGIQYCISRAKIGFFLLFLSCGFNSRWLRVGLLM